MHYVDQGQGHDRLLVHGTPDWSFVWRHLIKALSPSTVASRRIVLASASPANQGYSYAPAERAANLRRLIDGLGLKDLAGAPRFRRAVRPLMRLDEPVNVRPLSC
jgi:haloalkane dehalogenase